jgi:glutamyl-tRNA synthetase
VATKLGSVALDRQLRLALTGVEDGPEMSILMPMIGRARVEARLAGKIA